MCIRDRKNKGSMDICERALRYIEETYADAGLSLMTTSQEVGVSPNYCLLYTSRCV